MSRRSQNAAPRPDMVKAVTEMLLNLEQISPDPSIVGRCSELPGIVLDKILATCLDRDGPEYAKVNRDYEALRVEYFQVFRFTTPYWYESSLDPVHNAVWAF